MHPNSLSNDSSLVLGVQARAKGRAVGAFNVYNLEGALAARVARPSGLDLRLVNHNASVEQARRAAESTLPRHFQDISCCMQVRRAAESTGLPALLQLHPAIDGALAAPSTQPSVILLDTLPPRRRCTLAAPPSSPLASTWRTAAARGTADRSVHRALPEHSRSLAVAAPLLVQLDHADGESDVLSALAAGVHGVMLDGCRKPLEENRRASN